MLERRSGAVHGGEGSWLMRHDIDQMRSRWLAPEVHNTGGHWHCKCSLGSILDRRVLRRAHPTNPQKPDAQTHFFRALLQFLPFGQQCPLLKCWPIGQAGLFLTQVLPTGWNPTGQCLTHTLPFGWKPGGQFLRQTLPAGW